MCLIIFQYLSQKSIFRKDDIKAKSIYIITNNNYDEDDDHKNNGKIVMASIILTMKKQKLF